MSARNAVGWLLKQGYSPGQIANKRKVYEQTTKQTLLLLVGEGRIRRTDIYYTIPKEIRELVVENYDERKKKFIEYERIYRSLYQTIRKRIKDAKKIDIQFAILYYSSRIEMGDLYEDLRNIELFLNNLVKETLLKKYNDENKEDEWWYKGVPEDIRKECVIRRETDNFNRTNAWNYVDLIHLKKILEKRWQLFEMKFKKDIRKEKNKFFSNFTKLNSIRNSVMHPSRNDKITENDFEFITNFSKQLLPDKEPEFYKPN